MSTWLMGLTSGLSIEASALLMEEMPTSSARPKPATIPSFCNILRRDCGMLNHCCRSMSTFLSKYAQKRQSKGYKKKNVKGSWFHLFLIYVLARIGQT